MIKQKRKTISSFSIMTLTGDNPGIQFILPGLSPVKVMSFSIDRDVYPFSLVSMKTNHVIYLAISIRSRDFCFEHDRLLQHPPEGLTGPGDGKNDQVSGWLDHIARGHPISPHMSPINKIDHGLTNAFHASIPDEKSWWGIEQLQYEGNITRLP